MRRESDVGSPRDFGRRSRRFLAGGARGAVLASVPTPPSAATPAPPPPRGPSSSSSSSRPPGRTGQRGPSAPRGAAWYLHRPIGRPYVTTAGAGGPGTPPPPPPRPSEKAGNGRGTRSITTRPPRPSRGRWRTAHHPSSSVSAFYSGTSMHSHCAIIPPAAPSPSRWRRSAPGRRCWT
jgi:hypothetical protein